MTKFNPRRVARPHDYARFTSTARNLLDARSFASVHSDQKCGSGKIGRYSIMSRQPATRSAARKARLGTSTLKKVREHFPLTGMREHLPFSCPEMRSLTLLSPSSKSSIPARSNTMVSVPVADHADRQPAATSERAVIEHDRPEFFAIGGLAQTEAPVVNTSSTTLTSPIPKKRHGNINLDMQPHPHFHAVGFAFLHAPIRLKLSLAQSRLPSVAVTSHTASKFSGPAAKRAPSCNGRCHSQLVLSDKLLGKRQVRPDLVHCAVGHGCRAHGHR